MTVAPRPGAYSATARDTVVVAKEMTMRRIVAVVLVISCGFLAAPQPAD